MGYIYIFTNPSFPQYVKIDYATDVKHRLDTLNSNPGLPFAFRVYATYEVDSALSDKKLHSILDKLNPDLRSTEEVDGKKRIREFYAMTPEDAYSILEAIAEINGYKHRLKKWKATAAEQEDEALAQEISEQHQERMSPFAFTKCGIAIGEEIVFSCAGNPNNGTAAVVVDDKHVEYPGTIDNWVHKVCDEASLPHRTVHSLRHTNITMQIAAGVPLVTVSGRAGHARTSTTTDIYSHFLKSSDKTAAEKLEQLFE